MHGMVRTRTYLAHDHEGGAGDDEHLAAVAVDDQRGEDERRELDAGEDDRAHQRRVAAEAGDAEHQRGEEGQDHHAAELVAQRQREREGQVRAVLPPGDQPPERADVLAAPRGLHGVDDGLELGVHVGAVAAHAEERGAGAVHLPAHHEAARGVGEEEGADDDEHGRGAGEAEGEAPSPRDARGAVVGQVGDEYPQREEELEAHGERPAKPRGRHLGEVQRRGLVREPDAEPQEHPPDDEHGDVHRAAGHGAAGEEQCPAHQHHAAPAQPPGDAAGGQRRHEPGDVERRRERRERVAVEDAVLVPLRVGHPHQHLGEERCQERLHLRDAA
ncbi:Os04g0452650, partial [Oryza sativa Japonica Group]